MKHFNSTCQNCKHFQNLKINKNPQIIMILGDDGPEAASDVISSHDVNSVHGYQLVNFDLAGSCK